MWILDHLVDQTIGRIWRTDIESPASDMAATTRPMPCTQGGPKVVIDGTILLLLAPFAGLWGVIFDAEEITERSGSLT